MTKNTTSHNREAVLQHLILIAGDIFHDLRYGTAQNPAQVIDGGGVQRLVVSQFVQGGTGNAMIFY
jgi:hypothetical protein